MNAGLAVINFMLCGFNTALFIVTGNAVSGVMAIVGFLAFALSFMLACTEED